MTVEFSEKSVAAWDEVDASATIPLASGETAIGVVGVTTGNVGILPRYVRVTENTVRLVAANATSGTRSTSDNATVDVLVKRT